LEFSLLLFRVATGFRKHFKERLSETMNNNNNASSTGGGRGRKRGRRGGAPPQAGEPAAKKRKTQGQSRRARKRQARDGRAQSTRGDGMLTVKGDSRNYSGYANKASFPVRESEYIAEVVPSAYPAFSVQQFPVNPGQAGCFPWLARIAQNFEKYEFESLCFVYKREVSEYASNGQTGKVMMWFDGDPSDPAPVNKQQMEDSEPHDDCMPCENMRLEVPPVMLKRLNDAHFVRPGTQPANTDLKTYDVGVLNVACQGTAANTAVGELHVEYALRLRDPILTSTNYGVGILSGATGTSANTIATSSAASGGLQLSSAGAVVTATPLVIGGEYYCSFVATANSNTTVAFAAVTGCTAKTNPLQQASGATPGAWTFTANAVSATFSVTLNGNCTNPLIVVAQVPVPANGI